MSAIKDFISGGMINKIVGGAAVVMALSVWFLWHQLGKVREEKGALAAQVEEAKGVNLRQAEAMGVLRANVVLERTARQASDRRAERITDALIESQSGLYEARDDFRARLNAARSRITDEELVCALEFIPSAYFDSLPERPSSVDGPGGR